MQKYYRQICAFLFFFVNFGCAIGPSPPPDPEGLRNANLQNIGIVVSQSKPQAMPASMTAAQQKTMGRNVPGGFGIPRVPAFLLNNRVGADIQEAIQLEIGLEFQIPENYDHATYLKRSGAKDFGTEYLSSQYGYDGVLFVHLSFHGFSHADLGGQLIHTVKISYAIRTKENIAVWWGESVASREQVISLASASIWGEAMYSGYEKARPEYRRAISDLVAKLKSHL